MADQADNGKENQQKGGQDPEPTDWKAKYEAMKSHSREWERKAENVSRGLTP